MEDPEVVAIARDRRAAFEVCLTSNLHSGVIGGMEEHPLPDAGDEPDPNPKLIRCFCRKLDNPLYNFM